MVELIRRAMRSTTLWRYVDVFVPRVFALVLHAYLFARYGSGLYAYPAWILGTFSIVVSFLPDPHAFILARRHGRAAQRLLSLALPWIAAKLVLAVSLTFWLAQFSSAELSAPYGASNVAVIVSVCVYAAVEVSWSIVGTVALAAGTVHRLAVLGIMARGVALALIGAAHIAADVAIPVILILAALPVLGALLPFVRRWGQFRRSVDFGLFALARYALWTQGLALVTAMLAQAPVVLLGVAGNLSSSQIGQISFFTRIAAALLQPTQVLQSVVIAQSVRSRLQPSPQLSRLRSFFKGYAALFVIGIAGFAAYVAAAGKLDSAVAWICAWLTCGLAVSIWYRFELSRLLATTDVKRLLIVGYMPVVLVCAVAGAIAYTAWHENAIAVAVGCAWVGISLSWRWVEHDGRVQ